jgi:hypothetical protein
MTKNLHEPSTPRAVATNRYTGKLTQQKPYAYEWVTPVNDADCAAAQADPVTPWTPCYLNDWEQPTTLEPLSVRLNADGLLQWQGYVNAQNATAAIAFIMPGTLGGEPDMIPDVSVAENLSYSVFVTPDDGTTITQGRAYVDSTTGEVTITYGGGIPWARITRGFADAAQVIASNSFTEIDCTTSYNVGAGESGNGVFTVDLTDNTITVVPAGVVMVRALANWDSSITNAWILWVSNSEVANQNERRAGGGTATTMQDELMFLTHVPAGTSFSPGVWQIDLANRNLDVGFLEVSYMGTYTGTDFSAMDPDIS